MGTKNPLSEKWKQAPILIGSDAVNDLHLGHLYLISISEIISNIINSEIIFSVNEIESILSRETNPKNVKYYMERIKKLVHKINNDIVFHSRINDKEITLVGAYIFKKCKNRNLEKKYYGTELLVNHWLSVSFMIAAILKFISLYGKLIAIYGKDELPHLEFFYNLSRHKEFRKKIIDNIYPNIKYIHRCFNYVIIEPLPSKSGFYKMSKSIPEDTIFLTSIFENKRIKTRDIPEHIQSYFYKVINISKKIKIKIAKNSAINILHGLLHQRG